MQNDETSKPWLQRKSTWAIGAVGLIIIIGAASLTGTPAPAPAPGGRPSSASLPAQGLGTAGQSAEFNQIFASRLREEQDRRLEVVKRDLAQQVDSRVAAETARIRAEMSQGNQAVMQRLDDISRGQQEAADTARQSTAPRSLQFRAPSARGEPSGAVRPMPGNDAPASEPKPAGVSQPVIPPNGFISGRLLNGVVATVGEQASMFLVALEGQYKAANGFTVNLNGCMASVEGRANLAAGRIEGKPAEITCNFPREGRVQTWPVAGWVVDDKDGIRGLSASIVDNTGKKITASALAAAIGTAGATLASKQYTTTTGGGGTASSMTGSPSEAVAGGAVLGAGHGLSAAVNEHFALYRPTLQVGGGVPVTLVIANELPVPPEGSHITRNTGIGTGSHGLKVQP